MTLGSINLVTVPVTDQDAAAVAWGGGWAMWIDSASA